MDINRCPGVFPMTTSAMPDILTDIVDEKPIAREKIEYLIARAQLRLHDLILRKFAAAADGPAQLDQKDIADKLGVSKARISQQLGVPGNWTIESVTKLAAAIGGEINYTWMPFPKPQTSDMSDETAAAMAQEIIKKQKAPPIGSTPWNPPPQTKKPDRTRNESR